MRAEVLGQKRRPRRKLKWRPLKFVCDYEGIHLYLNATGSGWAFIVHQGYQFRYGSQVFDNPNDAKDAAEIFCELRVREVRESRPWMSLGSGGYQ